MNYLVDWVDTSTFDFAKLRCIFRTLDTNNSGNINLEKIRAAFNEMNMSEVEINKIFERLNYSDDVEINYTDFLAATVDRRLVNT